MTSKTKLSKVLDGLVSKRKAYEFKHHTEWPELEKESKAKRVFDIWYQENNDKIKHYNHQRHAFNWLCKHFKLITISHNEVSINNQTATLWTLKSFYEKGKSKSWIYQETDEIALIAIIDSDKIDLKDESLKNHAWFLKL